MTTKTINFVTIHRDAGLKVKHHKLSFWEDEEDYGTHTELRQFAELLEYREDLDDKPFWAPVYVESFDFSYSTEELAQLMLYDENKAFQLVAMAQIRAGMVHYEDLGLEQLLELHIELCEAREKHLSGEKHDISEYAELSQAIGEISVLADRRTYFKIGA